MTEAVAVQERAPPRGSHRRENLDEAIRARRRQVGDYWRKFPDTIRFLQDTMPETWDEISRCRMTYRYYRLTGTDWYRLQPYACWNQPWCIMCVRALANRRIKNALDAMALCTPARRDEHGRFIRDARGELVPEQVRGIHIVQTAPLTDDGQGWGRKAQHDPGAMLRAVWNFLKEAYGEGIGAIETFQPYGEQAFKKWHPHADLTLNGYRIIDAQASRIEEPNITQAWRRRMDDLLVQAAQAAFPGEEVRPGHLNLSRVVVGHHAYYPILKYQLREMVDVRKLAYNREKRTVWYQSYRDNTRTPYTIEEWFYGVKAYQRRYGTWGSKVVGSGRDETAEVDGDAKALHRRYGTMADRNIRLTARDIGGQPIPHGTSCPCADCGNEWDRVFLDDVDRAVGPPRPLRPD